METTASITLKAPAKINLYLHITGVLENGYHELDTLFFALDEPCDKLTFTPATSGSGCTVTCPIPDLKQEDNLVFKAYQTYAAATGYAPDLCVDIEKHIPTGAGLGGGSTDAATMLRYLNKRAEEKALPLEKLIELAAGLGADVPFFLLDTPARATGIGEKLIPKEINLTGKTLLLACPDEHVDTAWAYKAFDKKEMDDNPTLTSVSSHNNEAAPAAMPLFHNDFETVVFRAFPTIRMVKELLLRQGAAGAAMSGSGASVFALFNTLDEGEKAALALAAKGVKAYIRLY